MDTVIADLAQYGFIFSFVVAFVVWLRLARRQQVELLLAGVVGGVACLVLIKAAGAVFYDTRPFVAQHIAPLFPHAADNGFPSDHTAVTMLVGFCVLVVSRRWGLVLLALSALAGVACSPTCTRPWISPAPCSSARPRPRSGGRRRSGWSPAG